jgi:hypothetical protein
MPYRQESDEKYINKDKILLLRSNKHLLISNEKYIYCDRINKPYFTKITIYCYHLRDEK